MTAYAVIGAFYGDEGKGLVTDYLADQIGPSALVVRSNGGAQAAHTVQTPDGRRHVFHHFGSGSFVGARTHLSKFMIINPIAFNEEWDALVALGVNPQVSIDPSAMVTTPFDMLLNQAIETVRSTSTGRHGSCGLGIGETIERDEYSEDFRVRARDLVFPSKLMERLTVIRSDWIEKRWRHLAYMQELLGPQPMPEQYVALIADDAVLENYLQSVALFLSRVDFINDYVQLRVAEDVIFEGAQGLLLDPSYGEMPYCTRSNTGLRNVAQLCKEAGIETVEAHYVVRAYTTRHGEGPLDGECKPKELGLNFSDPTNVDNDWQGTIRVAPLSEKNLLAIKQDLENVADVVGVFFTPTLVMTCMDQMTGLIPYDGTLEFQGERFLAAPMVLIATYGLESMTMLTSWGPTRATIRKHAVETFPSNQKDDYERTKRICELNNIRTCTIDAIPSEGLFHNLVICLFDTEEERQLVRLTATKQLTNRVAAL